MESPSPATSAHDQELELRPLLHRQFHVRKEAGRRARSAALVQRPIWPRVEAGFQIASAGTPYRKTKQEPGLTKGEIRLRPRRRPRLIGTLCRTRSEEHTSELQSQLHLV